MGSNTKEYVMETKYYIVVRIDGDYAWLKRTDTDKNEEPVFIARALLPEGINEGTKLKANSSSTRSFKTKTCLL